MRATKPRAIGLALAMLTPTLAQAAVHVTPTQSITHKSSFPSIGDGRADGADFGDHEKPPGAGFIFQAFDLGKGVLVGATRGFTGEVSLKSDVSLDTTKGAGAVKTTGQTATKTISMTFGDAVPFPTLTNTVSCTTGSSGACAASVTKTASVASSVHITDPAALEAYKNTPYPTTTIIMGPVADYTVTNSQQNGLLVGLSTATFQGDYTLGYEYMDHANASFSPLIDLDVLAYDFGTVTRGAAVGSKLFSFTNLGDLFTVGLDLDSIVASGPSPFGLDLTTFAGLGADQQHSFLAYFDSSTAGAFSVDYVFNFSDADVGVGLKTSQLTLRLTGVVEPNQNGCVGRICPTSPTPEPATWAMMVLGFGAVGAAVRRRRPSWRAI